MINAPRAMRDLIARPGIVMRPAVSSPFMARIAQEVGFECVGIGGFALGAQTCITEPQLTMTEVVDASRRIQDSIDIPAMVDVGAGFGEAIQVWRMAREMEAARIGGVQMEDQVYPKRAHYHRDYVEHTIDPEHMVEKIVAFTEGRPNKDLVLLARTDSMRTHGYDEGVRRANAYAKAGADLVMLFPNTLEEAKRAPKDVDAPLVYVVSHGNRVDRPVPTVGELGEWGYKIASFAILSTLVSYRALHESFAKLRATGDPGEDLAEMRALRQGVEDLIGLPKLYEIEERTTEKKSA
jgi:2-methylisocitrate lyase-like PEP mutase family enzyme